MAGPVASRAGQTATLLTSGKVLVVGGNQAIDLVMVNSNGLRFAHDAEFTEAVARLRHRLEVYLQFDGFSEDGCEALRGEWGMYDAQH